MRPLGVSVPLPRTPTTSCVVDFWPGERIALGQMADELGVSRATLYRWVGARDALLLEVLWRLTE